MSTLSVAVAARSLTDEGVQVSSTRLHVPATVMLGLVMTGEGNVKEQLNPTGTGEHANAEDAM